MQVVRTLPNIAVQYAGKEAGAAVTALEQLIKHRSGVQQIRPKARGNRATGRAAGSEHMQGTDDPEGYQEAVAQLRTLRKRKRT